MNSNINKVSLKIKPSTIYNSQDMKATCISIDREWIRMLHTYTMMWKADSLEKHWWWERLKGKGKENGRGWDG